MDDVSEEDCHKEDEPASPGPPPSQQHTDPASPTVAVTPEPVVRGEQATPSEIEYQVLLCCNHDVGGFLRFHVLFVLRTSLCSCA